MEIDVDMNAKSVGAVLLIALIASGTTLVLATNMDTANILGEDNEDRERENLEEMEFEGEFDQVGILQADLEDPFKERNDFRSSTVDETPNSNGELTDANTTWQLSTGQDLGLDTRQADTYVEVDGNLEDVEFTVEAGNVSKSNIRDWSAAIYDYGRMEGNNEVGQPTATYDGEDDELQADYDQGVLTEGEYIVEHEYTFESGYTAPSVARYEVIQNLTVEGETDDDDGAHTIKQLPIQFETQ